MWVKILAEMQLYTPCEWKKHWNANQDLVNPQGDHLHKQDCLVCCWIHELFCYPLQAFQKLQDYTLLPTACSEASKLGASLSSLCLLINRKFSYL